MATGIRDRIFAIVGVIVIAVSVGALSAAVIIQNIISGNSSSAASSQTSANNLTCVDNNTEAVLPTPPAYTVAQPVTSLQTTDIQTGTGPAAKDGDCLVVQYYGTLAKDGTVFDENYSKTTGFAFTLGQGQVIPGWDQGVVGMQAGGERRLVIPATLAYGSQGSGSIPANADLVFYVTLLRIQ